MPLSDSTAHISLSAACEDSNTKSMALNLCKELSFRGLSTRIGSHVLSGSPSHKTKDEARTSDVDPTFLTALPLTRKATMTFASSVGGPRKTDATVNTSVNTIATSANSSGRLVTRAESDQSLPPTTTLFLPILEKSFALAEESYLDLYFAVRRSLLNDNNPMVVPILDMDRVAECTAAIEAATAARRQAAEESIIVMGAHGRTRSFRAGAAYSAHSEAAAAAPRNTNGPSVKFRDYNGNTYPSASSGDEKAASARIPQVDAVTPTSASARMTPIGQYSPFEVQSMGRFLAIVERIRNACFVVELKLGSLGDQFAQERIVDEAATQIVNLVKELGRAAVDESQSRQEALVADGGPAGDPTQDTFEQTLSARYKVLGRKLNSGVLDRFYAAAGLSNMEGSSQRSSKPPSSVTSLITPYSNRKGLAINALRDHAYSKHSIDTMPPTPTAGFSGVGRPAALARQVAASDVFRRISYLDLSMLVLGDIGLGVLCSAALPSLAALRELNLSDNNITNAGAAILLKQDQLLEVPVNLKGTGAALYRLLSTRGLSCHPSLATIDLRNNNLSQAGIVDLLLLTVANSLLTSVRVDGNLCDVNGVWCRRLQAALDKNAEATVPDAEAHAIVDAVKTKTTTNNDSKGAVKIISPLAAASRPPKGPSTCKGTAAGKLLIDWEYEPLRIWQGRMGSTSLRGRPRSASASAYEREARDTVRGTKPTEAQKRAKSAGTSRFRATAGQLFTTADDESFSTTRRDLFSATLKVTRHSTGLNMASTVNAIAASASGSPTPGHTPQASTTIHSATQMQSGTSFAGVSPATSINNGSVIAPLHVIYCVTYVVEVSREASDGPSTSLNRCAHPILELDTNRKTNSQAGQSKLLTVLSARVTVDNGVATGNTADGVEDQTPSTTVEERVSLAALYEVATSTMLLDTLTIMRGNGGRVRLALGGVTKALPITNAGVEEASGPAQNAPVGPYSLMRSTINALLRRQSLNARSAANFHASGGAESAASSPSGYSPLSFSPLALFSPLSSSCSPTLLQGGSPHDIGGPFFFHDYKHDVALKVRYTPMAEEDTTTTSATGINTSIAQPFAAQFFFECKSSLIVDAPNSYGTLRQSPTLLNKSASKSGGPNQYMLDSYLSKPAGSDGPPLPCLPIIHHTHRTMCQVTGANVAVYCGDAHDELLQLLEDLGEALVAAAEEEASSYDVRSQGYMGSVEERSLMMSSGGGERFFSSPTYYPLKDGFEGSPRGNQAAATPIPKSTAASRIEKLKALALEEERQAAPEAQAMAARVLRQMQR